MRSKFSVGKFFKFNSCFINNNYIDSAFLYVYSLKKLGNYAHFAYKV